MPTAQKVAAPQAPNAVPRLLPRRATPGATFSAALDKAQRAPVPAMPERATGLAAARSTPSPALLQRLLRAAGDEPVDANDAGQWASLINERATRQGIDPTLVAAVTKAESGFNPRAVSKAGAKGMMQLMDPTAKLLGVSNSFDPVQNVDGGTRYLGEMLRRFQNPELALAAYNAGPVAVTKHGGIPPFKETQTYVKRVLDYQRQMRGNGL